MKMIVFNGRVNRNGVVHAESRQMLDGKPLALCDVRHRLAFPTAEAVTCTKCLKKLRAK